MLCIEIFELLSLFWAWLSPETPESAAGEVRGTFVWIYDFGLYK